MTGQPMTGRPRRPGCRARHPLATASRRCPMFHKTPAGSDMADIRDRLAGTDPAQGELDRDSVARLAGIGDRIGARTVAAPAYRRQERAWWPGRPAPRRRRAMITFVAVPALLAASAAGWAI